MMPDHPVVRRGLRLLGGSFALAWVSTTMVVAPGSAAWVELSGRAADAGAFIATFYLAGAAGAFAGGRAMDRWGRRPVLVAAHALGALGYLSAGLAYGAGSLLAFVAAIVALAVGAGVVNLTRLAAIDLFPPASRGRAVAYVQLAALGGAIVGPALLVLSGPIGAAIGRSPQSLVWFFAPPLLALAALLVARGPEPLAIARDLPRYHPDAALAAGPAKAAPERLPVALAVAGVIVLAAAQTGMASVMGVAGVAARHAGHDVGTIGILFALHFVGMFGLSRVVGRVADRAGRRATVLAGLVTLAAGAASTALVPGVAGYGVGLLVVGFGWSFAYIGATVLLTDVSPPARRARVLGNADLVTALVAAAGSAGAGWWYAGHGLGGLGLAAALAMLVPIVAALTVRETSPGTYRTGAAPASPRI